MRWVLCLNPGQASLHEAKAMRKYEEASMFHGHLMGVPKTYHKNPKNYFYVIIFIL
jgi:hypothetical protein